MDKDYYTLYQKYKKKYLSLRSEMNQQTGGASEPKKDVILFKAEWCGHCQGFKQDWEKLQKENKKKYNFITYDSDKNKAEMESWQIQGFPTIIVKKGEEAMEYVGPNEYNSVLSFIKNI